MSKLLLHDTGRILLGLHETLHAGKRVRQVFQVPAGSEGNAIAWVYHRPGNGASSILQLFLNDRRIVSLRGSSVQKAWQWTAIPVQLPRGKAAIELRCDSGLWDVGFEPACTGKIAEASIDGGACWMKNAGGASASLAGRYLIRLRMERGAPAKLPAIVYADRKTSRMKSLRQSIPAYICRAKPAFARILALRGWIASLWKHQVDSSQYTSWDPFAILARAAGPDPRGTAICVHFGALLCAAAQSLGHVARCVAVTPDINSALGHFLTEIWDSDLARWVAHDANYDAHFEDARPLSAIDLANRALEEVRLNSLVRIGKAFPKGQQRIVRYFNQHVLKGTVFRHVAIWPRNDFPVNPAAAPPSHGATPYCETDWIWYSPDRLCDELGMFPHHQSAPEFFASTFACQESQ